MEIQEHRVRRLRELRDKKFQGQNAALGRALGYKSGAFIRQLLEKERPITEKTVTAIHDLEGCAGWMDLPVGSSQPYPPAQPTAALHAAEPTPTLGPLDWRTAAFMLARQCPDGAQRELLLEFIREVDGIVADSTQNSPIRAKFVTP